MITGQAVSLLLEWASKNKRSTQKDFATFLQAKISAYAYDESCGADGSGTINMTMMQRMLESFEEK